MTATSLVLILVGVFVIINAANFVGVLQGNNKLGFAGSKLTGSTANPATDSPAQGNPNLSGTQAGSQ